MKFKYLYWREKKAKEFNRENIFIEKAGVKYNVYDMIQEAREDTEIVPTLEKYGCLEGHMQIDPQKMYADFTGLSDLRGILDAKINAENLFYKLPIEERQHFNNDINQFTKNGKSYFENKIKEAQAKAEAETKVLAPTQTELNLEANNG